MAPADRRGAKRIISCEGKAEEAYFKAVRAALGLPKERIGILSGHRTDPQSVVQAALDRIAEMQEWRPGAGDQAWAVFDGDEHIDNGQKNWQEALQLAGEKNIQLAISNPSFELWYLLHYQDQNASLTAAQAERRLKSYATDYVKPLCLYPRLSSQTGDAIRRANALAGRHQANGLPIYSNPCSGIGVLFQSLLALRRRNG